MNEKVQCRISLTEHTVPRVWVAEAPWTSAGGRTVRSKKTLWAGLIAAEGRDRKKWKMLVWKHPILCPLQLPSLLPGAPIASLADTLPRHWITAPINTVWTGEPASISKCSSRAGCFTAAERGENLAAGSWERGWQYRGAIA